MTDGANRNADSGVNRTETIKFLYSYGGKIVPRGKLCYVDGHTRVLAVESSITFSELMVKFAESCGSSVILKCKLPSEDLDLLVSVKSDEDLRNVIEEYRRISPEAKIRTVLFPATPPKKFSPPVSPSSCFDFPSSSRVKSAAPPNATPQPFAVAHPRFPAAVRYPLIAGKFRCNDTRSPRNFYCA